MSGIDETAFEAAVKSLQGVSGIVPGTWLPRLVRPVIEAYLSALTISDEKEAFAKWHQREFGFAISPADSIEMWPQSEVYWRAWQGRAEVSAVLVQEHGREEVNRQLLEALKAVLRYSPEIDAGLHPKGNMARFNAYRLIGQIECRAKQHEGE